MEPVAVYIHLVHYHVMNLIILTIFRKKSKTNFQYNGDFKICYKDQNYANVHWGTIQRHRSKREENSSVLLTIFPIRRTRKAKTLIVV